MNESDYWQRFWRRRLTRRKALKLGAAGIGAGTMVLAGCGGTDEKEIAGGGKAAVGTPKTGGILHQGNVSTALSVDPHTEVGQGLGYVSYLYGYLMHDIQFPEGPPEVVYDHAQSFEQPDLTTYIFRLRQGIKWHNVPPVNGRELVADDVLYSFDRLGEVGLEPFWRTYIAGKGAPNPYTVELRLNKPYAYTIEDVGSVKAAIVAREAVEAWGDLKMRAAGSGPFLFKSFTQGQNMEAVKNPDYFVAGVPRLDGMEWKTTAEDASLQVAFRGKQQDVYGAPSKLTADELSGSSKDIVLVKEPSLLIAKFGINELSLPELQDVRVREAIDIACDRDGMIDKLAFGEGEYTGPVSFALSFWSLPQDELRQRFKLDLPKARQLLEAANAGNLELEIKFVAATHTDLAVMIKESLEEAGIRIKMVPQELGTWRSDQAATKYQIQVGGGLPYPSEKYPLQFNHLKNWTRAALPTRGPAPEIDALLDKIMETPDVNERQSLVLDVTRKILDRHGPMFYLFCPYSYTLRWNYVRGYEDVPSSKWLYTYDMWLDK